MIDNFRLNNFWIDLKYYLHCMAVIVFVMALYAIEIAAVVYIAKLIWLKT